MSFNKVNIGGKFFPPEWFDFDRSEKPMENIPENQHDDDWFDDDGDYPIDPCPECGDDDTRIVYLVEDDEDGYYNRLECNNCGSRFNGHRLSMWE